MSLATFRHTAGAAAHPDDVWTALQVAETWGGIGLIESVWDEELDDEGQLTSFKFRTQAGGRSWEGTARKAGATPGEQMDLVLSTKEIKGRVGVTITPDGDRTMVAVRLEAEPVGMLATMFWSVVREAISSSYIRQVEDFAAGFGA